MRFTGGPHAGVGKPHRTLVGPETFIAQVADDAMAPRVRAGGYIWIDPDEPAVDGRLVAVRDPDRGGETAVRRLVERDGRRTLRALDERDEAPRVDDGVESRRPPVIKSNAGKARAPRMPARRWRKRGGTTRVATTDDHTLALAGEAPTSIAVFT